MALNQTFGENPLFCFKVNAKKKKKKKKLLFRLHFMSDKLSYSSDPRLVFGFQKTKTK